MRSWAAYVVAVAGVLSSPRTALADYPLPVARVALGPAFHFAPEEDETVSFALDATAGAELWLIKLSEERGLAGAGEPWFFLSPEVGYGYDGIDSHAFAAVLGIGVGGLVWGASYRPRFLFAREDDVTALGMRNGLAVHVLANTISLELGHQYIAAAEPQHDMRLMVGLNAGGLIWLAAM